MSTLQTLPRINIQPSYPEVYSDITSGKLHLSEDIWVSIYELNHDSIHGKVRLLADEESKEVLAEVLTAKGVSVQLLSANEFFVASDSPSLSIPPTTVKFPTLLPLNVIPRTGSQAGGVDCIDISPDGNFGLVGGKNGLAKVIQFPIENSNDVDHSSRIKLLDGHVGDVERVRFFPSSEVCLTCSSDLSIRVYSVLHATNVRALRGHTQTITDIGIIDRGKIIVSVSMDKHMKLWRVASSETVASIRLESGIICLCVITGDTNEEASAREYEDIPRNTLAVVGQIDGRVSIYDLSNPTDIRLLDTFTVDSRITAIEVDSSVSMIIIGTSSGQIQVFKRNSQSIFERVSWLTRCDAGITSLQLLQTDSTGAEVLVGSGDGLPFTLRISSNNEASIKEEYAGIDCENCVCKGMGDEVWIGAQDGKLRKYIK